VASTPGSSNVSADRDAIELDRTTASWCSRTFFAASPVYPILDAGILGERDPSPVVRALAGAGVRVVQFRGKGISAGAFAAWVSAGVRGALESGVRAVVNDRADVALLAGADGVHLGQDDVSARVARRLLGPRAVIGLSTHTREEMRLARDEPADYLAVGPVFETVSKADSAPVVALSGVREARRLYAGPLVAIGGIDRSRIGSVIAAGADAAAVISAVRGPTPRDVADQARALLAAVTPRTRTGSETSLSLDG
jgi:thiamine-phosphate pyrophosphorylase